MGFALASSCSAGAAPPDDPPRVVEASALGVDVSLRYHLHPADHPGGDDDTGPYLDTGAVAIDAGPAHTRTLFSLGSLHAIPPNYPQVFPAGEATNCGSAGPVAIEHLARATYPAVIVTTVIVVKGCAPVVHAFVPASDTAATYVPAPAYAVTHPLRPLLGLRANPLLADATLRVTRVREIRLPEPPASEADGIRGWTVAIVDGTDAAGKPTVIAIDRPHADELPDLDETISLFKTPLSGLLPSIRLSAEHERRYTSAHPQGAPLPTPPPPPVPPPATATPLATPEPAAPSQ
jgi:hypothetical protein